MTGELIGAAEAGLYGLQLLTTITLVASHSVIPSFREPEQKHLAVLQSRVVKKEARFTLPLSGSTQWTVWKTLRRTYFSWLPKGARYAKKQLLECPDDTQ